MMNPEELFEKLINDEISREEFEALLEGLDDDGVRDKYDQYLESKFEEEVNIYFEEKGIDQKAAELFNTTDHKQHQVIAKRRKIHLPIAASLLILIGTVFSILFVVSNFNQTNKIYEVRSDESPQLLTKSTPNRRMFRMRLEDGSFVHMNAMSQISYPQKFNDERREVEILGEAYFDIERDESRPFIISVKGYKVQVLGTSFNIEAYEDEEDFSVTVESGTVQVTLDNELLNPIILTKNKKLVFSPETDGVQITDVDASEELNWRKGILRFDSTPMAKVEKMLERWYGIELVIEDEEIYHKTLSGVHQNENLKSVIESLTYATGTKYLIKDNSIIIKN